MGFIYVRPNSKWNFWKAILQSSYAHSISCKEFRSNFVLYYIEQSPFLILIEHLFVCFETIIIGALASMPLPCLSKLGLPMSCAEYTTALKYSCCTWIFCNTKYHLGCLNETFSFSIHRSFDTFPSFLLYQFKAILTMIFVDAKTIAQ